MSRIIPLKYERLILRYKINSIYTIVIDRKFLIQVIFIYNKEFCYILCEYWSHICNLENWILRRIKLLSGLDLKFYSARNKTRYRFLEISRFAISVRMNQNFHESFYEFLRCCLRVCILTMKSPFRRCLLLLSDYNGRYSLSARGFCARWFVIYATRGKAIMPR